MRLFARPRQYSLPSLRGNIEKAHDGHQHAVVHAVGVNRSYRHPAEQIEHLSDIGWKVPVRGRSTKAALHRWRGGGHG
jgi:hypothetical protein